MAPRRRDRRRALLPLLGAVMVLGVACGGAEISPDTSPSVQKVLPDPCSLLTQDDVVAALAAPPPTPAPSPPTGGSSQATPQTSPGATAAATPTPTVTPLTIPPSTYAARAVTVGGKTVNAGVCTYQAVDSGQLIVSVLPKTTLASLAEGGALLGPAQLLDTTTSSLLSLPYGDAVIELAIVYGQVDSVTRANRLAALGSKLIGSSIPTLVPLPAGATPGARPGFTPPPPPGAVVSNQTAATKVKEVDSPSAAFSPVDISVKAGDVVEWDNVGSSQHNVIFDEYSALSSDTMNVGATYQLRFTVAGTYSYRCTFHTGMTGGITVR